MSSRTVNDAAIQVRWRISEKEQEQLTYLMKDEEAFVLLVAQHLESGKEMRYLIALKEAFQYVMFSRPGQWELRAGVVTQSPINTGGTWIGEYTSAKTILTKKFLQRESDHASGYQESTYSWEYFISADNSIEMDVPMELFAKEPPAWEKKWVTLLWGSPLTDQCDYRKRRIFAYTAQPILLVFVAAALALLFLFRVFAAIACVISGFWFLHWKHVFLPFSFPSDIWKWQIERDANIYVLAWRKWKPPVTLTWEEQEEKVREEQKQRHQRVLEETALLLNGGISLGDRKLPQKMRIRLLVNDLKAKVCRPMRR
ncbi:MAG: hypothetical protein ABIB12_01870 [Patescibacteria group bacterium]